MQISPVFDNGTSLGYEIPSDKFKKYENSARLETYVLKGWHHMKWRMTDDYPMRHSELVKKLGETFPETRAIMLNCLQMVNFDTFKNILAKLVEFSVTVRLTPERADFMLRLLQFRHQRLLKELEK